MTHKSIRGRGTKNQMDIFCVYCGRKFSRHRFAKGGGKGKHYGIRPAQSITCSKKHSNYLVRYIATGRRMQE